MVWLIIIFLIIFLIIIVFLTRYTEGGMGSKQNPKIAARAQNGSGGPSRPPGR
jgi:preprotein translocase subunit SecG